ncbi:MAG: 23S rRNA (guanosine(2251)-2'-O)-methyltransferase RlmB [Tenericutes bacterium]|nr:23S rRNA (guanosine(2251)-2'-O)-methyltransferase RlmB [Mycoplasmatota bacterium]
MIVYGRNVAKEVLSNNLKINKVLLQEGYSDQELIDELNKRNVNIKYLNKNMMNKLEEGNHQGIILDIEDYEYYDEAEMFNNMPKNPFIVILDHLEDPHNFGAIIRTCEAAGVDYIIIPKDRSVRVNKTVMKVSAGALNNVKIVMTTNLNRFINKIKENGVWVVGTALSDSVYYDKVDYNMPVALIIGNEGKGISQLVKKNCDFVVKIPMIGKINSLNASVAAGIMIYEVVRQRGTNE